jgi:hypothetical protein
MIMAMVRPEEARVFDSEAGYHQFHAEQTQEPYGSFQIYWQDELAAGESSEPVVAGWYWWECFPGSLPEGPPNGPFASSRQALKDADECSPEFDGS